MTQLQQLASGAQALGLALDEAQIASLLSYLELIRKWNRIHNLTALHEPEKMLTHHLLDSLAVAPHITSAHLLDVGSGAGLPGIPLAIARPDWRISVSDSNLKKASFQQQAVIELALQNVQVVPGRVEDAPPQVKYAGVISRAFSELNAFVACTRHVLAEGGRWYAMKGVHPDAELADLPDDVIVEKIARLTVPDLHAERHLIILKVV
ncbi:MAG TPA: 16S rRNA (guanine(527)-N(7))-methyltransferase RsmG [Betaproteobacteria bacterium]|nr:16S rRNA (guanine(527)-N(7))-methyltransferase RsmG [Betaproteobacteria bacterium]